MQLFQRRSSLPSLGQNSSQGSPVPGKMTRRNSTPSLQDAATQSSESAVHVKPSSSEKIRKSGTVSAFAGCVLQGAPGNALRRAVNRIGNKAPPKTDEEAAVQVQVNLLKQQAKADKKRLHELYHKPSQLCIHQMADHHHASGAQRLGDTDVGMVRLAYSKIRSLREEKDYENVYKRNSWKDLVDDLRHGIRVCMKAQAFINILVEASLENEVQDWCVNPSIEKQRVWNELLSFLEKPSLKSQLGNSSENKWDQELANYKAMIMSSTPPHQSMGKDEVVSIPKVTDYSTLQPRAPSSPRPEKCSPMLTKLMRRPGKPTA